MSFSIGNKSTNIIKNQDTTETIPEKTNKKNEEESSAKIVEQLTKINSATDENSSKTLQNREINKTISTSNDDIVEGPSEESSFEHQATQLNQVVSEMGIFQAKLKDLPILPTADPLNADPLRKEEEKIVELFKKKMENTEEASVFKEDTFLKFSRRETLLNHTYYVDLDPSSKSGNLTVKLQRVVHGPDGFVGEGGVKIAKKWITVGIDTKPGSTVVSAKFKDSRYVQHQAVQVLKTLEKNPVPYTDPGRFIQVQSIKRPGEEVNAVVTTFRPSDLVKRVIENNLTPEEKHRFSLQALGAVRGLHEQNIVNRDLKPENMLIEDGTLYISDFDFAMMEEGSPGEIIGSPTYMAPELLKGEVNTIEDRKKVDAFALGVSLYILHYGKHPMDNGPLPLSTTKFPNGMVVQTVDQNVDDAQYAARWKAIRGPLPSYNKKPNIDKIIFYLMHPNPSTRTDIAVAQEIYKQIYPGVKF